MYFLYFKAYLCDYMRMLIAKKIEMQVVILQKHNAYKDMPTTFKANYFT